VAGEVVAVFIQQHANRGRRQEAVELQLLRRLRFDHPLIRNGLDLILSGDTGSSTISLLKNKALPVGTLLHLAGEVVAVFIQQHANRGRRQEAVELQLLRRLRF
jgi:hypothetical protein